MRQTIANVAFGRHVSAPPLTLAEMDELRILAPHLRRAVVISRILEMTTGVAATFAQTLDASRAGVVLVDRQRRVIHANSAGRAMLAAGDPVHDAGGQLELPGEIVPGALARAIEGASEETIGGNGAGVPARRLDGSPLTV